MQNFLFTKKLALEASFEMIKEGQSREAVMERIRNKTNNILASDDQGIYSKGIRKKQLAEIGLLVDHYCKLLQAEGREYATLVIKAYERKNSYVTFLDQLKETEEETKLAAMKTLRTLKAPEIVSRMEEATDRVRMAEADRIFGTTALR